MGATKVGDAGGATGGASGTMTVKDAAARLELAVPTIYQLIRMGQLPARRLGPNKGKILIDSSDVERYWAESKGERVALGKSSLKHFRLRRG